MSEKQKKPATMREASRENYFSGTHSPLGYNDHPTTDQLKVGALQRSADAQERIAAAMERANELLEEGRRHVAAAATVGDGADKTMLAANMVKGGTHVDIQLDFTNPVKAAVFFENFMQHLKTMVDAVEQEGGQSDV